MSDVLAALRSLAADDRVTEASDGAREACTQLRWHQALRRRIPEAAAESRVRGAWASGELDGARSSIEIVRDLMRGAREPSPDPDPAERVLHGAIAATAATEGLGASVRSAPRQAYARLHLAAASHLVDSGDLGRPRTSAECAEFSLLGPAPDAAEAAARLFALDDVIAADDLPTLLVVAIAHAEIVHARPFARGNGLVARALDRVLLQACGLDPTGVVVPEAGHGAQGGVAYHGALQAYGSGSLAGLMLWIDHCADAVVAGAREGGEIADAVLAGRFSPTPTQSG